MIADVNREEHTEHTCLLVSSNNVKKKIKQIVFPVNETRVSELSKSFNYPSSPAFTV